jgi:hypothetical protein
LISKQDGFARVIAIHEEISDYWIPNKNAWSIDNQDRFAGVIDIHKGILNYRLPNRNDRFDWQLI